MKHDRSAFFVLIAIMLLAGCRSSNKVVSTFGKRKYTKGYYCFGAKPSFGNKMVVSHGMQVPIQKITIQHKVIPNQAEVNHAPTLFTRCLSVISKTHTSKIVDTFRPITFVSVERKISEPDGVPGHGILPDNNKGPNTTYCGLLGFIFSLLGPVLGIAISSLNVFALFFVLSLVLSIIGLSIASEPHRGFAIAGLVIDIIEVLLIVLFIILLIGLGGGL